MIKIVENIMENIISASICWKRKIKNSSNFLSSLKNWLKRYSILSHFTSGNINYFSSSLPILNNISSLNHGAVNRSSRYMASGLSDFSPILKAVLAVAGEIIASTLSKAFLKSCFIIEFWLNLNLRLRQWAQPNCATSNILLIYSPIGALLW